MKKKGTSASVLLIYTGGTIGMIEDARSGELKPFESATQSSATPSPTPTDTSGTAASTVCTEGNNRVKK